MFLPSSLSNSFAGTCLAMLGRSLVAFAVVFCCSRLYLCPLQILCETALRTGGLLTPPVSLHKSCLREDLVHLKTTSCSSYKHTKGATPVPRSAFTPSTFYLQHLKAFHSGINTVVAQVQVVQYRGVAKKVSHLPLSHTPLRDNIPEGGKVELAVCFRPLVGEALFHLTPRPTLGMA